LTGSADNDEVVRPARHPISGRSHGVIEGRQENVRPKRAGHSLNAKGNFRFERTIVDWRSGFVLDLRRKE
jgi:hypothetical protein